MKRKPYIICVVILSLIFAAFAVRLADWQLFHGAEYRAVAARAAAVVVTAEAVRGEILDCSGKGLVTNTAHHAIVLEPSRISENERDRLLLTLIELTEQTGDKRTDELDAGADIRALKKTYKINGDYDDSRLRGLVSVLWGMEHTDGDTYTFASDVSEACVSAVSEHTQGIDGVEIQTYHVRSAEQPSLAPHLIGALGAVSAEEYEALADKGYGFTDSIGKFGIEAACESELRGTGGEQLLAPDADGDVSNALETTNARRGNTVWLTLDSDLQKTASESLADNVRAARKAGAEDCTAGAAVMLDVGDFSVLAAASCPTYDLNSYSEYGDYYIKLTQDESAPMFNRACSGSFACGSVFKPCVALAALREDVITPETTVYCARFYDYYPSNIVACMHYHGEENLFTALAHSCNVFFAETGRRLGIERMSDFAAKAGLGEYTGLEIDESRGVLAGRDSDTWTAGNTVQAAIGQSDNAFTPMQLATYTATVANNGTRLRTHLVKKITDYNREKTLSQTLPETVCDLGVEQKHLDAVTKGMLDVTQSPEGTAYGEFADFPVKVAAKTGTAENAGSDHAAFICFAPFEAPEVAVAVVIEHGANTTFAMRTAKDMLRAYFEKKES